MIVYLLCQTIMATKEDLRVQCDQKLTSPDGVYHENGVFLFPASEVANWYRSSGVESVFRGLAVRSDAELHIDLMSVDREFPIYDISVYLELAKGESKFSHRLQIKPVGATTLTADNSILRRFWNATKEVIAEDRDIDAFSGFINSADDYNVLLPGLHPSFYRPMEVPHNSLILPDYRVRV